MSCIESMGLSETQRAAVLDTRPRALVAAGAGSGKTRLLVAYFVHALVDEGFPIERLVAVTFTRKAGAELVSRIRSSLHTCGRPDLARALDVATIGTIHGLCRRLLKEHALEAGVDPAFTILEAEAAVLVKEDVCRRVWDLAVEQANETELEVFASRGETMRRSVVPLYDRLRGTGQDDPQVVIAPGPSAERVRSELVLPIREALAAGGGLARRSATLEADLHLLEACVGWLADPTSVRADDEDLRITAGFFPSRKTPSMEPHFAPVRMALTRYRCALAERRLRPVVSTMNDLLAQFHRHYETYKQERSLLDFADLELRTRALLAGGATDQGSSVSLPGSRILIDEFQDTNELQCTILEGLGAARLLMVGDERQSIYRFRGADVEVFRRRQTALEPGGRDVSAGGALHRLDVNYRSRPELLAFVNRLFAHEHFFGKRFVALEPGRDPTERVGGFSAPPSVEVLVAARLQGDDLDAPASLMQQAEADAVGSHVRLLIDNEGWAQRDIVVLLPAQTHVGLYQEALLARGVDVYVVRGKGYYSQEEVSDVSSLLQLLVNPHDDLALVAALRSPLVGVSDDTLYVLGQEARRTRARSLWEVVRGRRTGGLSSEDRGLLIDLVEQLTGLRRLVGRSGLAKLIDEAISVCGYDVCLLASPDGKRRFANVRKLMRMADDFEALEGPDLAGFLQLLQSMGDLSDREGSAPTLAEGEDVVRVMTVHQAKGLEFPVVILAGLGSDVPQGSYPEFVIGSDGRMGVFLKGSRRKNYESRDLFCGPAAEILSDERDKALEEDVRLLYVAMTRAQERLVLVGARPGRDKSESCRIGRVVSALGLHDLPEVGAIVPLKGLDAVVVGVAPPPAGTEGKPRQTATPVAGDAAVTVCPRFLETASRDGVPRRLSFSALAVFQRCPMQFYLERMLGLAPMPEGPVSEDACPPAPEEVALDGDELRSGREVGLLVHALLERLPPDEEPPTLDSLRSAAPRSLLEGGARLSPADLERALLLTRRFWESSFADKRFAASAMREAPFAFDQGDIMISGVMDLIWQEDHAWHIVDYKTNALNGRSTAEAASGYQMQAVLYCLAALRAGAPAAHMDFLFLERPAEPVTVRFGRDDVSHLESLVDEALQGLMRAEFPVRTGEACVGCSVADVCASMARP
jgi:ATP-dependent helicase/nuclease subunit A